MWMWLFVKILVYHIFIMFFYHFYHLEIVFWDDSQINIVQTMYNHLVLEYIFFLNAILHIIFK